MWHCQLMLGIEEVLLYLLINNLNKNLTKGGTTMGKHIRNGIVYGGGPNKAKEIATDGGTSVEQEITGINGELDTVKASIDNLVKTKEITFNGITYPSGNIGTRGYQANKSLLSIGIPINATVVGLFVSYVQNSVYYNPITFISGNAIFLNLYRASTEAITTEHTIKVTISYI